MNVLWLRVNRLILLIINIMTRISLRIGRRKRINIIHIVLGLSSKFRSGFKSSIWSTLNHRHFLEGEICRIMSIIYEFFDYF